MGAKRGVPLRNIEGVDNDILQYLRAAYGITTLEEVVEAFSGLSKEEQFSAKCLQSVYQRACEILGSEKVCSLENFHKQYSTGAMKPPVTEK